MGFHMQCLYRGYIHVFHEERSDLWVGAEGERKGRDLRREINVSDNLLKTISHPRYQRNKYPIPGIEVSA